MQQIIFKRITVKESSNIEQTKTIQKLESTPENIAISKHKFPSI